MKNLILALLSVLIITGCKLEKNDNTSGKLNIVCTTSMIGDCFDNIVSENMEVTTLMGPGVDPHLYDPRPSDLKALDKADVIIYNGFHLEGKFIEKFEKLKRDKVIIALSDFVKKDGINDPNFENSVDPHFWHNPTFWNTALIGASKKIIEIRKEDEERITANMQSLSKKIKSAEREIETLIAEIPTEKRILITSHDAFHYFGNRFGLKVNALQGISTLSESGLKEVSNLVDFIIEKEIPTIFIESSVSHKSLESVKQSCKAKGYTVSFGTELFSDALGEKNSEAGDYVGMLLKNAKSINEGLAK